MKIELVCTTHEKSIEISKELYDFLKEHCVLHNANLYHKTKTHYALRITDIPEPRPELVEYE